MPLETVMFEAFHRGAVLTLEADGGVFIVNDEVIDDNLFSEIDANSREIADWLESLPPEIARDPVRLAECRARDAALVYYRALDLWLKPDSPQWEWLGRLVRVRLPGGRFIRNGSPGSVRCAAITMTFDREANRADIIALCEALEALNDNRADDTHAPDRARSPT